ncbi:MAG: helix-turn-helix domain-containing protein [Alphaproteobacteria bacterium]|nr:helix-turn-helix domain-containing protein [Alphaproteobacteria bacterium]
MSLFQRIKAPFTDSDQDEPAMAVPRPRPVGEMLRARREELRLDINEVGEILRIKPAFLAALEENRPQDLPGPTYVIGFVRAYARHLGLDHDWVLERYKAESAGVGARPDLALPMPLGERSLPGGPILLVALILAICGYGTWYYLSTGDRGRPERVAAVPPTLQPRPDQRAAPTGDAASPAKPALDASVSPAKPAVEPATPTNSGANARLSSGLFPGSAAATAGESAAAAPATDAGTTGALRSPQPAQPEPATAIASTQTTAAPTATAAAASPAVPSQTSRPQALPPQAAMAAPPATAPATQPPAAGAPPAGIGAGSAGRIEIKASADCWVQVRGPDQSIVFSRVLKAGEIYRVPARPGLVMRTGNAGALSIIVDGKAAPSIGPAGALRRNVVLDPDALIGGKAVQG